MNSSYEELKKERKISREKRWKKEKRHLLIISVLAFIAAGFLAGKAIASEPVSVVNISEGTETINKYQYYLHNKLQTVSTPSTLKTIKFSAFDGCSLLNSIYLNDGLNTIENRSFAKCSALSQLNIPDSVTNIGNAAFYDCISLKDIRLPNNITKLENNLFYHCTSLQSLMIPNKVKEIGQQCFYNCTSLVSLDIPDSVITIDDGAFYGCSSLQRMVIPKSVTSIGTDAFFGCNNLVVVCDAGSYAERFANSCGIKTEIINVANKEYLDSNVSSNLDTINSAEISNLAQVPKTGIRVPYVFCVIMLMGAIITLVYLKRFNRYA